MTGNFRYQIGDRFQEKDPPNRIWKIIRRHVSPTRYILKCEDFGYTVVRDETLLSLSTNYWKLKEEAMPDPIRPKNKENYLITFKIPASKWNESENYRRIFEESFSFRLADKLDEDRKVICRCDQYGYFIVRCWNAIGYHGFGTPMDPLLISKETSTLDVSENP